MGSAAIIGEIAKERDVSLKELSRRVDIPYTTLYNAVKRDSKMDFETVQKIAQALHIDVGILYGVAENKGDPQHLKRLYSKISEVAEKYGRSEEEIVNWINKCLSVSEFDMSEAMANRLEFLSEDMAKNIFEQVDSLGADEQLEMAEGVNLLKRFKKEDRRYVLDTVGMMLLLNAIGLKESFKRVSELAMLESYTKPISELADGSEDKR